MYIILIQQRFQLILQWHQNVCNVKKELLQSSHKNETKVYSKKKDNLLILDEPFCVTWKGLLGSSLTYKIAKQFKLIESTLVDLLLLVLDWFL